MSYHFPIEMTCKESFAEQEGKPTAFIVTGPTSRYVQKRNAPERLEGVRKKSLRSKLLLQNEYTCLNKIDSPYVPKAHAYRQIQDDGTAHFLVDYVSGQNLESIFLQMNEQETLKVIRDISFAVQDIDEAGVSHHDIKPGNIIVGKKLSKLIDFGIAKLHDFDYRKHGMAFIYDVGSEYFMAPEHLHKRKPVPETDIYMLARTLLYCIQVDLNSGAEEQNKNLKNYKDLSNILSEALSTEPTLRPSIEEFRKVIVDNLRHFSHKQNKGKLFIR